MFSPIGFCPYSQLTLTLSHPDKNLKGIFQACNVGLGIDRITFWYKWLIPPRTLHTILMVLCPSFNLFFPMALFCSSLQNWVSHLQPLLHFWSISFWIKFVCLYFSLSFFPFKHFSPFFFKSQINPSIFHFFPQAFFPQAFKRKTPLSFHNSNFGLSKLLSHFQAQGRNDVQQKGNLFNQRSRFVTQLLTKRT